MIHCVISYVIYFENFDGLMLSFAKKIMKVHPKL